MPIDEPESDAIVSDKTAVVARLVAQMSAEDRTLAVPSGRELWKLIRQAGRPDAGEERARVESELILALKTDLPTDVRREVLWMLSEIGSDQSVGAVATLLTNGDLREDARMTLERLPGGRALAALQSAFDTVDEEFKPNLAQSLRSRGVPIEGYPCQKLVPVKTTDVQTLQ